MVGEKETPALVHRKRSGALLFVGDVRGRAGRDPAGPRRDLDHVAAARAAEPHCLQVPVAVGDGLLRLQVLDEGNPFLQGLDDLLVVQAVGGRVLHGAAVDDGDAAPFPGEAREGRVPSRPPGAPAVAAHFGSTVEKRGRRAGVTCSRVRKFLARRRVIPYSAPPPKPARGRSSSGRAISLQSRKGRIPLPSAPVHSPGSGSIFNPSIPTTPKPSFKR